jgi:dTDP-4-amino-4,6-dideoxygalactose transaminase
LAHEHGLAIVEDAAHAIPARYKGKLIGSGHNFAAFSFYATKNMTTGEGGALTGPPELLKQARIAALHGMSADGWKRYEKASSWYYDIVAPGFKYNMTDIQAALGKHQLRRLEAFHCRRQEIASGYCQAFSGESALEVPVELAHVQTAWHLYVLRLRLEQLTIDRDRFIRILNGLNIGTSVHFIPVHSMSYYRDKYGYCKEQFPVATCAFERMLSIPLHPGLSERDVDDVTSAVLETVELYRA